MRLCACTLRAGPPAAARQQVRQQQGSGAAARQHMQQQLLPRGRSRQLACRLPELTLLLYPCMLPCMPAHAGAADAVDDVDTCGCDAPALACSSGGGAADGPGGPGGVTVATISFVDLAGSERGAQAATSGDKEALRIKEVRGGRRTGASAAEHSWLRLKLRRAPACTQAGNINKSLLTLSSVIRALADSPVSAHPAAIACCQRCLTQQHLGAALAHFSLLLLLLLAAGQASHPLPRLQAHAAAAAIAQRQLIHEHHHHHLTSGGCGAAANACSSCAARTHG